MGGLQDFRFMEEDDLVGLLLKPIERRRFLERVSSLKVAFTFIGMRCLYANTSASYLVNQCG